MTTIQISHLYLLLDISSFVNPVTESENTTELQIWGLIDSLGPAGRYKLTDRGRTYLQMILDTPLPVQVWTDPRTAA